MVWWYWAILFQWSHRLFLLYKHFFFYIYLQNASPVSVTSLSVYNIASTYELSLLSRRPQIFPYRQHICICMYNIYVQTSLCLQSGNCIAAHSFSKWSIIYINCYTFQESLRVNCSNTKLICMFQLTYFVIRIN